MKAPSAWWLEPALLDWVQLMLDSHRQWTGRDLIDRQGSVEEQAARLYEAPFVAVSHGSQADPILKYGNRVALELWEMDWREFTRTPSRLTAEPENRAERERMLAEAAARGYIDDYRGIRRTKTGRRFLVEDALVWNVVDQTGRKQGQAATFARWTFLS